MNNPFCKYKDLFGPAGSSTGIRKYRIFGIVILDVLVTLIFAVWIAWYFHFPYIQTIVVIFILGVLMHRLFCVRTAVDKMLFS
jgi:hypothetical protein